MTLDISRHRNILIRIIKDIYTDGALGPVLGFKGGTAAHLLYSLPRFSVDLDFDLLDPKKEDCVFEKIEKIISKYGRVKESHKKHHTLFFVLSYAEKENNIKVEIRRKNLGSRYEVKNHLGIPVKVMVRPDMFANKIVAMSERLEKTNRDIFDIWFFLENDWPINTEIIEKRTGLSPADFIKKCIKRLEAKSNRSILSGIGELLDEKQKIFAKTKMKDEVIFLLKLRLEGLGRK